MFSLNVILLSIETAFKIAKADQNYRVNKLLVV